MVKKSKYPRGKFRGYGPGLIIAVLIASLFGSSTMASFAATRPTGTLDIITYNGLPAGGAELGNVTVTVGDGGSGVNCAPTYDSTDANSGPNHGHVRLTCPAAMDGGKLAYKLVAAERAGYSIRGDSPQNVGSVFHISKGATTTLSIGMKDDTPPPPQLAEAAAPAVVSAPAQESSDSKPTGIVDVTTYSGSIAPGNELSGVKISTSQGGSGVECETPTRPTDPNSGGNHGHLHILCRSADAGGPRTYRLNDAERDTYEIDPASPFRKDSTFTVSPNKTTVVQILMRSKAATATDPAATPATPATPASPATPKPATPATPAQKNTPATAQSIAHANQSTGHPPSEKTGSVQVTAYKAGSDGKRTRVSGVNIHIQSVDHKTDDSSDSCIDYNKTTVPTPGADYGQVHFTDCWTTKDGSKEYQLSYAELPAGLSYESLAITNGSFKSGKNKTTDGVNEKFEVKKGTETKLELNLHEATAQTSGGIREVTTATGTRFIATDNKPENVQAAQQQTTLQQKNEAPSVNAQVVAAGEDTKDLAPPSVPKNVTAIQDNAGVITIIWDAATGNPVGEDLTYTVNRSVENSQDAPVPVDVDTDGLSTVDEDADGEGFEYGPTYIYTVTASDEEGNPSSLATVTLKTRPIILNIKGNDDADGAGASAPGQVPGTQPATPPTVVPSADDAGSMKVSSTASDEDLACTVADYDANSDDTLPSIGVPTGNVYVPTCTGTNGENEDTFAEDVDIDITADDSESDADLYGYDGTDWELVSDDSVDTQDGEDATADTFQDAPDDSTLRYTAVKKVKNKHKTVYTIKTKHLVAFALVRKHHAVTPPKVLGATFAAMFVVGIVAVTIVRRRAYATYEAQYYDTNPTNPNYVAAPTVGTTMVAPSEEKHE